MTVLKMARAKNGRFTKKSKEVKKIDKKKVRCENDMFQNAINVMLIARTERLMKSAKYMRIAIWVITLALAITTYGLLYFTNNLPSWMGGL